MKNLFLALILSAAIAKAQNAQPAAPPAPPTPPAAPAEPAPPGTPVPAIPPPAGDVKPAGKAEKVKPLAPGDQKFAKKASEVLQYQIKLADRARTMKEDAELATWAGAKAKELTEKWTPFATICGKYGYTEVATDISKKETGEIAKLSKAKAEKFRQEYLELFMKESKSALRDMENAPKMVQNAELKTWAEGFVSVLKANAPEIETKYKDEKKRK